MQKESHAYICTNRQNFVHADSQGSIHVKSLLLSPWSRHARPYHAGQVLLADTVQQSDTPRQRCHDEDGESGKEEERRTDILLLARRPTPVCCLDTNRFIFVVFDVDNAGSASACPAIVSTLLACRVSILLVAISMAAATLCCGDTKSLGGMADRHGDFRSRREICGVHICWHGVVDCRRGDEWMIYREWFFFLLLALLECIRGNFVGAIGFCAALGLLGSWWHKDDCALLNIFLMHEFVKQIMQQAHIMLVAIAAESFLRNNTLIMVSLKIKVESDIVKEITSSKEM